MRCAILGFAGIASACSSFTPGIQTKVRIQEKPAVFNNLSPQQQGDILGGAIERNYTTDMVYLALGRPKKIVTSADGKRAMWVFVENYAAGPDITYGFNGPQTTHYAPGFAGASSNPIQQAGSAYWGPMGMGTTNYPFLLTLTPAEMKTKTIYVFFLGGRVAEIKLDGDASDQKTSALNQLPPRKRITPFIFPRSAYGGFDE